MPANFGVSLAMCIYKFGARASEGALTYQYLLECMTLFFFFFNNKKNISVHITFIIYWCLIIYYGAKDSESV